MFQTKKKIRLLKEDSFKYGHKKGDENIDFGRGKRGGTVQFSKRTSGSRDIKDMKKKKRW